ncbi:MAG: hypothetical protein ACPL3S_03430 [Halothiobacillaceae bacterium]
MLRKGGVSDPTLLITSLWDAVHSYYVVRAEQETRREEIRAHAQVAIRRIEADAQILREYFAHAFAERSANFDQAFALLHAGLEKGEDKAIEAGLTLILTLVKESPIKAATEAIQQIRERRASQEAGRIIDL